MTFKEKYSNTYCIVAKSVNRSLPHIISCSIGIQDISAAKAYSKQMAKVKNPCDGRLSLYEWTKPVLLKEALESGKVLIMKTDEYYLSQECKN
jgi:hypothetical protein